MDHAKTAPLVSRRALVSVAGTTFAALVLAGQPSRGALAQASEVPIGALMPLSGAGGPFGQKMLKAVRFALVDINGAGGPLGRKIKLFEENSQTDPEAAVRAAVKLMDINKVVAIIGTWASGATLAVAPITQRAHVVEMSTSGASEITKIQKKGYVYRTEPDDFLFGHAYADFAIQQGWEKASVLGLNVPFTATTVAAFRKQFEADGGKVLSFTTYNESETTFRSEILKALQGKPDFIHISGYAPDITSILKEAYSSGVSARFLVPGFAVTGDLIKKAGPAAEGVYLVQEGVAEDSPAHKRLSKALGGEPYNPFAAQAYDQINLVALAIEAAGKATGEAINGKMRAVSGPSGEKVSSFSEGARLIRSGKNVNYEGASGPIDFNAEGNIGRADFRVAQIKNGAIVPIGWVKDVRF